MSDSSADRGGASPVVPWSQSRVSTALSSSSTLKGSEAGGWRRSGALFGGSGHPVASGGSGRPVAFAKVLG